MDEPSDLASALQLFLARARRSTRDLAALSGLSRRTLENWRAGHIRHPRAVIDLLKVARALALEPGDTELLLRVAGHAPLAQLQAQALQTCDPQLIALLPAPELPHAPGAPSAPLRYQLRAPVADFVGRACQTEQLLAALDSSLTATRAAVICGVQGMGGIGKTELAYFVAQQLLEVFPNAQLVLQLAGASLTPLTPAQALQSVIRAFEPDALLPEDVVALQQRYRTLLHGQRVLIVADDARDASQVQALLPPAGSALLITSRQRFVLPGMVRVDLEQLSEEEAVVLLRSICPGLSEEQAQTLARACGYLPLALRISGGILQTDPAYGVIEYLARLADERQRLAQLRDPDDGHLDVEASLRLSYVQLDAEGQAVFRQLGVLAADFAGELAEAVVRLPGGGAVKERLHQLLRRNLVMYDVGRRRWRLHDLVRIFARRKLETAGELEATMWRYAQAGVGIAQEALTQYLAGGEGVQAALTQFDAEWPHINAAQRWAMAYAGTPDADKLLLASILATDRLDWLPHHYQHNLQRERILQLEAARDAADRLGDRHGAGQVLNSLANAYIDLGDSERAIMHYEQALSITRMTGDQYSEGRVLNNLGAAYRRVGDVRQAISYFEQRLVIARALGDRRGEGITLHNLGIAYDDLGDVRQAIRCFEQRLVIARALGDRRGEGITLNSLGIGWAKLGQVDQAITYHEQALALIQEIGDRYAESMFLVSIGDTALLLGQPRRTYRCCMLALEIARSIGDRHAEGCALRSLGRAYMALNEPARAISTFEQALAILQEVSDGGDATECRWQFGLALVRQGEREQALALLRAAVAYERERGHVKAADHAALLAHLEAGEELPAALPDPADQWVVGAGTVPQKGEFEGASPH